MWVNNAKWQNKLRNVMFVFSVANFGFLSFFHEQIKEGLKIRVSKKIGSNELVELTTL